MQREREGGGFFSNVLAQVVGGVLLALALAGLGYLGLRSNDAPAASPEATAVACPEAARSVAGHALFELRYFETEKSKAYICRDDGGLLWYHGYRKSDAATITLRADQDANGFVARDARGANTAVYRVNDGRLTKTVGRVVELDEVVIIAR